MEPFDNKDCKKKNKTCLIKDIFESSCILYHDLRACEESSGEFIDIRNQGISDEYELQRFKVVGLINRAEENGLDNFPAFHQVIDKLKDIYNLQ